MSGLYNQLQKIQRSMLEQSVQDDLSSVAQNTSQISNLKKLQVNVLDQGLKGDGSIEDATTFQTFLNGITKPTVIRFPYGIYKFNAGLTINPSYHILIGDGATLDFSGLTTGFALNFVATNSQYRGNNLRKLQGFEIIGAGRTSSVDCFNLASSNSNSPSRFYFKDLWVHDFRRHITIGSQSYLNNFENCEFSKADTILYVPSGITNSGERITFNQCTLYESRIILDTSFGACDIYYNNCSLDYCDAYMTVNGGAKVFISGCHIECNGLAAKSYGGSDDYMFKTSGGNSGITVTNSEIAVYGTTTSAYSLFYNAHVNDFTTIKDCVAFGIPTDRLVTSTGKVTISNLNGVANNKSFLPCENLCVIPDPTMEGSTPLNQFVVTTSGTATVAVDATTSAGTGVKSIKFTKTTSGDSCSASITFPIRMGQQVFAEWKHKYTSVVQGTNTWEAWQVSMQYLDANANVLQKSENYYTGTLASFTKVYSTYFQNSQPVKGCTQVRIAFSIFGGGTGTVWLDDVYINVV